MSAELGGPASSTRVEVDATVEFDLAVVERRGKVERKNRVRSREDMVDVYGTSKNEHALVSNCPVTIYHWSGAHRL